MPATGADRGTAHFGFVKQATGTLDKVREYISAGMETTVDVTMDLFGENETVCLEVDDTKVSELKKVMLDYIRMERELSHFMAAVEHTMDKAKKIEDESEAVNLESILDEKLAELQQGYTEEELHRHERYTDLLEKIHESLQSGEAAGPSTSQDDPREDTDIEFTQEEVNTKCPYTGMEMVNPVRNRHCHHSYDQDGINEYMKRRGKKAKCPVGGCANTKTMEAGDLEENKELRRIIERKNRQAGKRSKRTGKAFTT